MTEKRLFVVRKYIWASCAKEAIRKDRDTEVDDVWIDEEWKKMQPTPKDIMGFYQNGKNRSGK